MRGNIDGLRRRVRSTPPQRRSRRHQPLGIGLVMGMVIAGVASYFLYFRPPQVVTAPEVPNTDKIVNVMSSEPSQGGSIFANDGRLSVDLYDSGAGSEAIQAATKKLEAAGFSVTYLGVSQLPYDATYIWYRSELAEQATAAKAALGDPTIVSKSSQISGAFGILIYLGKK